MQSSLGTGADHLPQDTTTGHSDKNPRGDTEKEEEEEGPLVDRVSVAWRSLEFWHCASLMMS
jgi:hypothetical protein